MEGNDRADKLAGKTTVISGLLLGRSEVLWSLRHYLPAQSQEYHTIDLEEKGVERGCVRRSSLKGRKRAIISLTNIGTVSKTTFRETSERRGGAHKSFFECTGTVLNRTEQQPLPIVYTVPIAARGCLSFGCAWGQVHDDLCLFSFLSAATWNRSCPRSLRHCRDIICGHKIPGQQTTDAETLPAGTKQRTS